jgi:hypothetical protein
MVSFTHLASVWGEGWLRKAKPSRTKDEATISWDSRDGLWELGYTDCLLEYSARYGLEKPDTSLPVLHVSQLLRTALYYYEELWLQTKFVPRSLSPLASSEINCVGCGIIIFHSNRWKGHLAL